MSFPSSLFDLTSFDLVFVCRWPYSFLDLSSPYAPVWYDYMYTLYYTALKCKPSFKYHIQGPRDRNFQAARHIPSEIYWVQNRQNLMDCPVLNRLYSARFLVLFFFQNPIFGPKLNNTFWKIIIFLKIRMSSFSVYICPYRKPWVEFGSWSCLGLNRF